MKKYLIAGNWKMNMGGADGLQLAMRLAENTGIKERYRAEMLICPPAILLKEVAFITADSGVLLGGQDCHEGEAGAHTGDISASMLSYAGCSYVILGHSERRQDHGETSRLVNLKANRAHQSGLKTIICVGETFEEREEGKEKEVIAAQLAESLPDNATAENTVIAYEPIWAIGTGKVATLDDILDMHSFIRSEIKEKIADYEDCRILYGGSVKPTNAAEIMDIHDVDGVLVGGASLDAESFAAIAGSC